MTFSSSFVKVKSRALVCPDSLLILSLMMIIGQTIHTSSVEHFFLLLRSNISFLSLEEMLWFYPIFLLIKFLEFPYVCASNLQFYWSKIWRVVHSVFSMKESLVFFQTFKLLDDICVIHSITIITSTGHCMHSQKPLSNIFHYIIIKKSTFTKLSYLTTNWIIFWTRKVYFLRLWVAMVMSYMSGIVIFMVKWCGTQHWLRVYGSNPPGNLTKNRKSCYY